MCRGLAAGYDTVGYKVICTGVSSHTKTLGDKEDNCIKLEIIIDDNFDAGYLIALDEQYFTNKKFDKFSYKKFQKYITRSGTFTQKLSDEIKKWEKRNKIKILKWLLNNQSYKKTKGDIDNSHQKTKGDTYNSYQKTKGDTDNRRQETKGDTYNNYQKTKGDTDNSYQKTEGDTYNNYQKTKGDTDNRRQETKGDTYNSHQKTKGEIYINNIKNYDAEIDDFIDKLTSKHNNKLTWKILVKLAMKGDKIK